MYYNLIVVSFVSYHDYCEAIRFLDSLASNYIYTPHTDVDIYHLIFPFWFSPTDSGAITFYDYLDGEGIRYMISQSTLCLPDSI